MMDDEDVVRRQLIEDNAYFKKVLNLIPAQFYFSADAQQKLKTRDMQSENKATKRVHGKATETINHKKARLDPTSMRCVTELQEYLIETEQADRSKSSNMKKAKLKTSSDSVKYNGSLQRKDEVRHKLHEYLSQLKAKRNALGKEDFQEKKKLKRRESKMKRKLKLKMEKQKGNSEKGQIKSNGNVAQKCPAKKPIYNKEGKLVFSKFDLAEDGKKKKKRAVVLTGKDYKTLMDKVQKQKEKIEKLKQTDEQKAKELTEKIQWNKVIQKAEGVKVKDDPELLKKSMKKKEKMKEKRKKKWEERNKEVQERIKERQEKRRANLQKRKQSRIAKKIAKAKKKGRIIPGF